MPAMSIRTPPPSPLGAKLSTRSRRHIVALDTLYSIACDAENSVSAEPMKRPPPCLAAAFRSKTAVDTTSETDESHDTAKPPPLPDAVLWRTVRKHALVGSPESVRELPLTSAIAPPSEAAEL